MYDVINKRVIKYEELKEKKWIRKKWLVARAKVDEREIPVSTKKLCAHFEILLQQQIFEPKLQYCQEITIKVVTVISQMRWNLLMEYKCAGKERARWKNLFGWLENQCYFWAEQISFIYISILVHSVVV